MVDIVTRLGKGSPLTNAEVDANFTNLAEVSGVTGEPMGHEDRTTSTISFNASTRTFTIAPVASSFTVWCKGKKVVVSTAQTVTIPNTTGMYSIYYDANGVLSAKSGYFTFSLEAPTAYVYWNAATGTAPYFGDERHGVVLDWQTHEYLHRTRGAALASGFSASGYVLGGNGSSNSHAQITLEGGTFFDEDMKIIVTATNTPTAGTWEQDLLSPARIPVLYLSGTGWVIDSPTDYPLKQGTARPQYNAYSGGVWSTADVANNKYATSWILATNNLTYPVIAIIGQAENDLQSAAEAVDFTALQLPGFPSVEFRPLYKLIFQCADSCTNAVHASLVSITDIRSIAAAGTAASIVTDHGNLSGLSDDDHPQYIHVDTLRTVSAAVKASFLPSQTSNAGKFLQTDGTATSWQALTSGNVTTALGFTPYNATNPSGYISGITSGMVTTALGFTPYNATNPSGYVTAAGARGAISVTGAGSYDSATGVINIVGGVTSFNTRTGAITLSSADVTTALGFTPYNNTNPSGYITGITSTMVTTALGFTPYNSSNPNGYISSITSANVTTALGFTPYNATNPSGYITSSALSGYLTSASAASTYLPLSGGTITGNIVAANNNVGGVFGNLEIGYGGRYNTLQTKTNADTLWLQYGHSGPVGIGYGGGTTTVYGQMISSANGNQLRFVRADGTTPNWTFHGWGGGLNIYSSAVSTLYIGRDGPGTSLDVYNGSLTQAGNQVLHAGNYNSYAPTLTGGGASGTWGINVTGSAGSATNALRIVFNDGPRDLTDRLPNSFTRTVNFDFVGAGTGNGSGNYAGVMTFSPWTGTTASTGDSSYQLSFANTTGVNASGQPKLSIRNGIDSTWNAWYVLLHSGNVGSYALPLSGGTVTGTLRLGDSSTGLYLSGGRLNIRSESTDNVAEYASYGLYLPKSGQAAGLYVESPIEARGGLRLGNSAGSGTITVGADTGATANRLVQRDSGGDVYQRYSFAVHFNQSGGNSENPTIGQIWTNSTSDNYVRKSTPAHFISQLGLLTTSNYSSYAPTLTGGGASGTWGINITGNAGSATTAAKSSATTVPASTAFTKWLFATNSTSGTQDWNHVSNTRPGVGEVLLLGNHANGPGGGNYYHPLNFEYSSIEGSGNVTQLAIAYGSPGNELYMRGSYSGSWNGWNRFLNSNNYSSYALPLSGGTVTGTATFNAATTNFGNSGSNTGIAIYSGSATGDYGRIRFYEGGSNTQTIHVFPNAWQGGGFTNNSAGSINFTGQNGVTFGDWNVPGAAINKAGEMWLRSNLYLGYSGTYTIGTNVWAGGGGYPGYSYGGGNHRFGFSSASGVIDVYADGNFYATDSSHLVLHAANYNSYAPTLTGGNASGSWNISITGAAASAGSANVMPSTGYGNGTFTWRQESGTFAGQSGWASYLISNHGDGNTYYSQTIIMPFWSAPQYSRKQGNSTVVGPYTFLTTENYTSINYPTANNAIRASGNFYIDTNYGRGIVGVYSSYRYQGVFAMGDSYKLADDGTTTGSLYGMAWSHPNAGGAAGNLTDHGLLIINNGGFRCAISNSIVASGNVTAYSDERLKTNWRDMPENFVARLAQVKVGIYDRTDEEDVTQVGVSAQSFQKLLPQAIMKAKDEMGTLSVSYGNAALASAVELAKDNVELRARIERLESLINKLIGD